MAGYWFLVGSLSLLCQAGDMQLVVVNLTVPGLSPQRSVLYMPSTAYCGHGTELGPSVRKDKERGLPGNSTLRFGLHTLSNYETGRRARKLKVLVKMPNTHHFPNVQTGPREIRRYNSAPCHAHSPHTTPFDAPHQGHIIACGLQPRGATWEDASNTAVRRVLIGGSARYPIPGAEERERTSCHASASIDI
jgi:hypothetical protein